MLFQSAMKLIRTEENTSGSGEVKQVKTITDYYEGGYSRVRLYYSVEWLQFSTMTLQRDTWHYDRGSGHPGGPSDVISLQMRYTFVDGIHLNGGASFMLVAEWKLGNRCHRRRHPASVWFELGSNPEPDIALPAVRVASEFWVQNGLLYRDHDPVSVRYHPNGAVSSARWIVDGFSRGDRLAQYEVFYDMEGDIASVMRLLHPLYSSDGPNQINIDKKGHLKRERWFWVEGRESRWPRHHRESAPAMIIYETE